MMLLKLVLTLVVSAAFGSAAEPILKNTFAADAEGWVTMGKPGATLATEGGALVFGYGADQKAMSVAVRPLADVSLKGLASIRFEVKTDSAFAVGVVLSEKKPGGGNYTAVFWSSGGGWQPVALRLSDFLEGEGPNEAVDADGKLDPEELEGVGLIDVSQIIGRPGGAMFSTVHEGRHTISIRNFTLSRDPVAPPAPMVLEDFSTPQPLWISPGAATLTQSDGALKIAYRQQPEQAVAFIRPLPKGDFRGATHLAFDIASDHPGQFVWAFAEARNHAASDAARYNCDFSILEGGKLDHREIALSAFTLDGGGPPDANGRLDLDRLRTLNLLDISQGDVPNTVTLKNIRFVAR
jgi:hypothetical protein